MQFFQANEERRFIILAVFSFKHLQVLPKIVVDCAAIVITSNSNFDFKETIHILDRHDIPT